MSLIRSAFGGTLTSLELSDCHLLTKAGLLVFFTPNSELGSTVTLRRVVLSNLGPAVDDDVASSVFSTSDVRGAGEGVAYANLGGAKVSDRAMETAAKHARGTLEFLDVSACYSVKNEVRDRPGEERSAEL